MRKMISIILTFSMLIVLTSCGNNNKPSYTKEFSYLPSYSSTMKLISPSTEDKTTGFSTAKYTVKDTTNDEVLKNYEKILKKDGWTVYQDNKPNAIGVEKGTHQATIIPQQDGKNVNLTIITK